MGGSFSAADHLGSFTGAIAGHEEAVEADGLSGVIEEFEDHAEVSKGIEFGFRKELDIIITDLEFAIDAELDLFGRAGLDDEAAHFLLVGGIAPDVEWNIDDFAGTGIDAEIG